jgi:hypothetical protein
VAVDEVSLVQPMKAHGSFPLLGRADLVIE